MDAPIESLNLRLANAADEKFLVTLYKSSRGDDLRGLGWDKDRIDEFLEMQHEAHRRFFEADHQHATEEIILLAGTPVGSLMIERRANEIRCVDIALLPEYRNRGLGTQLIRRLQDEARTAKKPLTLQVIRFNRSINLFERLGFVRTSETGTHFQMEWLPK